jgi:hypothetical protein
MSRATASSRPFYLYMTVVGGNMSAGKKNFLAPRRGGFDGEQRESKPLADDAGEVAHKDLAPHFSNVAG